jgi:hypothetical protein
VFSKGVRPGATRFANHLSSKSRLLVTFWFFLIKDCCLDYLFLVFNRMAPRKTGFDRLMAEFRKRRSASKSREKVAKIAKEKAVNFLAVNSVKVRNVKVSARIVTSTSDSQAVEPMAVDLTRPAEFRKRKSASKSREIVPKIAKEKAVNFLAVNSVKVRDVKVSARIVTSISDSQAVEPMAVDLTRQEELVVAKSEEDNIFRILGEISEDKESTDREIDATKKSGFPREWRLIRIASGELPSGELYKSLFSVDSELTDRRDPRLNRSSRQKSGVVKDKNVERNSIDFQINLARRDKSFFSVDPFQLNDFETVWESFLSSEVSSGISDYRSEHCQ